MKQRPRFNKQAYRAKVLMMGIMISAITILYQNCAKIHQQQANQDITVIGKISTQQPVEIIGSLDSHNPGNGPVSFLIHANGRIQKSYYENPNLAPVDLNCSLNTSLFEELMQTLETASICFYEYALPDGTVCTQQFTYPYFKIKSQNVIYQFGMKTSGCGDTFELCGDQRQSFKSLVHEIKQDLTTNCNN